MMIIFVEFIDQLIDYPINRASLSWKVVIARKLSFSEGVGREGQKQKESHKVASLAKLA